MDKNKWKKYNKYKLLIDLFSQFIGLGLGGILGTVLILPFIETLSIPSIILFGFSALCCLIFTPLRTIYRHKRDNIWREIENDD